VTGSGSAFSELSLVTAQYGFGEYHSLIRGFLLRVFMNSAVLPQNLRSRRPAIITMLVLMAFLVPAQFHGPVCPDACADPETGSPSAVRAPAVCEPRLPLDIIWIVTTDDPSIPGAALTLVVSAKTDLPSVRLELLLPENASLLSGPRDFQGKLGRGEEARIPLRVSSRGAARLQARVTAVTPRGLAFQRGATLDLDADGKPASSTEPGRLLRTADGRSLREFRAAPPLVRPGRGAGEAGP